MRTVETLNRFAQELKGELFAGDEALDEVRDMFGKEKAELDRMTEHVSDVFDNAFRFMEDAFGESQEMAAFVTELNADYYSVWFIKENGNDRYYRHNKGLLFDERSQNIMRQMDEAEDMMNRGIK